MNLCSLPQQLAECIGEKFQLPFDVEGGWQKHKLPH